MPPLKRTSSSLRPQHLLLLSQVASVTPTSSTSSILLSIHGRQDYFQSDGRLSPIQEWAKELSELHSISYSEIEKLLKSANYNAQAVKLMTPNKGQVKRSWSTYKNRFIEPIRIQAGLDFWEQNADIIQQTADQYGVPPEILVSIIGVETIYGRYTGNFRVLDALLTLGWS